MKVIKTILLFLLLALVVIQFFRPERNLSTGSYSGDISALYPASDTVAALLKKACNDCHSNNTQYPWYANIQPVAWWLADHVREGKRELNFNEFATYPLAKQYHKLEEVSEMVKEGEMPLSSYTLIHTDAKLASAERLLITKWADSIRGVMKATYPADSLIRKRR